MSLKNYCETVFKISFPPTNAETLKSAYRKAMITMHPDRNKSESAEQEFIELQNKYEFLKGLIQESVPLHQKQTTNGYLLSELGKGLPSTVNGDYCPECKGNGYTPFIEQENIKGTQHSCGFCSYGMVRNYRKEMCNRCNNGIFTLRSGRQVDCRVCKGTGVFIKFLKYGSLAFCPMCGGREIIWEKRKVEKYQWCWECKGIGEIEISNPVLPKNAL